ncbi:MAG: prepilin-type N-terminal cleavage/methylation domain-containing protein [Candidatus Pacebacteria bacterium]|nr:prepilin-type N-terminal cleavage/methylation domain-containing protein [Candidatus Paceibacterota bacterium]
MKQKKSSKIQVSSCKNKGFTLVEALIAISIMIVGILSGLVLVTRTLYNSVIIRDRLTASFLAQESMELVRQIRDTNFLKILSGGSSNWREGLSAGRYIIETNVGNEKSIGLIPVVEGKVPNLFYDDNYKIYNYNDLGSPTSFNREIQIEDIPDQPNEIRVKVIMKWKTKGINFDLKVEDHLFNWINL